MISSGAVILSHRDIYNRDNDYVKYNVVITAIDVDNRIKEIEERIDEIQYNIIDKFNNSTFIEIED